MFVAEQEELAAGRGRRRILAILVAAIGCRHCQVALHLIRLSSAQHGTVCQEYQLADRNCWPSILADCQLSVQY